VGTGAGAGMALMFVLTGVLSALAGVGGYLFPVVRNAEGILPDHDAAS
jgi:DHA3 family macrolide efflux protein-like MFS transporter